MATLYFDFRDIPRSARLGWAGKKMWVGFCGIAISYVGYWILTYVALLSAGANTFGKLWDTYGLFPEADVGTFTWYSCVIYALGLIFVVAVLMLTATMISKIAYQQLKDDEFYSIEDSRKFLRKSWKAALLSPLALLLMIVFFIACGIIIGILARYIPYVGEIGFSLFMLFIFSVSLVAVFLMVIFGFSFILSPAVVGTTGEDTMETITQLFSTVWNQPWRLIIYEAWLKGILSVAVFVLSAFSVGSLRLVDWACGLFMGDKLAGMTRTALFYLPAQEGWAQTCLQWVSGSWIFGPSLVSAGTAGDIGGTVLWSGRILAIMLLVLMGFILSYCMSSFICGQTLIYIALRKKKDDENLLERKEEEEEEPWRPPEEEERGEEAEKPEGEEESSASEEGTENKK